LAFLGGCIPTLIGKTLGVVDDIESFPCTSLERVAEAYLMVELLCEGYRPVVVP
jgi:hypothetical protein